MSKAGYYAIMGLSMVFFIIFFPIRFVSRAIYIGWTVGESYVDDLFND